MFGRKKKVEEKKEIKANIQVIPEDFYGTKDPVIHYASNNKDKITKKENFGEVTQGIGRKNFFGFWQNKKIRIIVIVIFFVLAIIGISWYYFRQAKIILPIENNNLNTEQRPENLSISEVETEVVISTSSIESAVSTTPLEENLITPTEEEKVPSVLEFPSMLLDNTPDADFDSLSDAEEFIFGTNNAVWDTDGDGYYDGLEVFNLYNPGGVAPMKIVDSGLAKEYVNPIWQYRVYYPAQWAASAVDFEAKQVLLSALSGDYIEILSEQKDANETFTDWFGRRAVGQQYSDLITFSNRYKEVGLKRRDDLVAYFVDGDKIYVIVYHPGNTNSIMYRHIMQMVIQSFRHNRTTEVIPDQEVLPPEPGDLEQTTVITSSTEL